MLLCFIGNDTEDMKSWWIWGYWISPLMYEQNTIMVNEFLGNNWNRVISLTSNFRDSLFFIQKRVGVIYLFFFTITVHSKFK